METIEKISDTELKITTTSEEIVTFDVIKEKRVALQEQIDSLQATIAAGEETYMATKHSYLEQITTLTEQLKKYDGQLQQAAQLEVTNNVAPL